MHNVTQCDVRHSNIGFGQWRKRGPADVSSTVENQFLIENVTVYQVCI